MKMHERLFFLTEIMTNFMLMIITIATGGKRKLEGVYLMVPVWFICPASHFRPGEDVESPQVQLWWTPDMLTVEETEHQRVQSRGRYCCLLAGLHMKPGFGQLWSFRALLKTKSRHWLLISMAVVNLSSDYDWFPFPADNSVFKSLNFTNHVSADHSNTNK